MPTWGEINKLATLDWASRRVAVLDAAELGYRQMCAIRGFDPEDRERPSFGELLHQCNIPRFIRQPAQDAWEVRRQIAHQFLVVSHADAVGSVAAFLRLYNDVSPSSLVPQADTIYPQAPGDAPEVTDSFSARISDLEVQLAASTQQAESLTAQMNTMSANTLAELEPSIAAQLARLEWERSRSEVAATRSALRMDAAIVASGILVGVVGVALAWSWSLVLPLAAFVGFASAFFLWVLLSTLLVPRVPDFDWVATLTGALPADATELLTAYRQSGPRLGPDNWIAGADHFTVWKEQFLRFSRQWYARHSSLRIRGRPLVAAAWSLAALTLLLVLLAAVLSAFGVAWGPIAAVRVAALATYLRYVGATVRSGATADSADVAAIDGPRPAYLDRLLYSPLAAATWTMIAGVGLPDFAAQVLTMALSIILVGVSGSWSRHVAVLGGEAGGDRAGRAVAGYTLGLVLSGLCAYGRLLVEIDDPDISGLLLGVVGVFAAIWNGAVAADFWRFLVAVLVTAACLGVLFVLAGTAAGPRPRRFVVALISTFSLFYCVALTGQLAKLNHTDLRFVPGAGRGIISRLCGQAWTVAQVSGTRASAIRRSPPPAQSLVPARPTADACRVTSRTPNCSPMEPSCWIVQRGQLRGQRRGSPRALVATTDGRDTAGWSAAQLAYRGEVGCRFRFSATLRRAARDAESPVELVFRGGHFGVAPAGSWFFWETDSHWTGWSRHRHIRRGANRLAIRQDGRSVEGFVNNGRVGSFTLGQQPTAGSVSLFFKSQPGRQAAIEITAVTIEAL